MPAKKSTTSSSTATKKVAKTTRPASTKKASKKAPKVEEEIIEETVEEEIIEEVVEEGTSVKKSRAVTKETVEASFDSLLADIAAEVAALRPDVGKKKSGPGIRFLGQITTRLTKLKSQSLKIARGKKKAAPSNPNSGFKKKVPVSEKFQKFAGWGGDELHSRIDATKFICDYIKENNLQNPDDKRRIIPDDKLRKILACDKEVTDFRYCDIQTYMKNHYL
jgi:upstream activation factor subunit UAF30